MPFAGKVISVHAFARAITATVTALFHKNDATMLTGDITPVAGSQTVGTLLAADTFAAGDELQLKITTNGSGLADDLGITLVVRPLLQDE